ncbi:hypothetical protein DSO57_1024937 [Entomophthora muscae]|uniref:Uncharacterized protein n=1 Tax=Entomophthora muscae TaxID=34485 RepID=A0ACC2UN34_9FUNG|nr:hypothetical protein DSO57_1024937 [Entomophthora muscae]
MKYSLPASLYWLTCVTGCSVILDSSNFNPSISKGTWFVKFYTPWCTYCNKLALEWFELSRKQASLKDKEFYFGEVDCEKNALVCSQVNVKFYPTLFLFHNGVFIDSFDQDAVPELTAEAMDSYVTKKAEKYNPKKTYLKTFLL